MKENWLGFKFALSYFSIIPVKFQKDTDLSKESILANFLFYLPLVGLILGAMSIGVYLLLRDIPFVSLVIASLSYPMLYGFVHTEAIIDVVDAIYAKHSFKDAYTVIKEPTIGALGALWGVSLLLIKTSLFGYLLYIDEYMIILSVLLASRLSLQVLFVSKEFKSSFLNTLKDSFSTSYLIKSFIVFGFVGTFLAGWWFIAILISSLIISYAVATITAKKLGFYNGDVVGFSLEICEIVVMLGYIVSVI